MTGSANFARTHRPFNMRMSPSERTLPVVSDVIKQLADRFSQTRVDSLF